MKRKNLLITLGLAVTLGVGVAAGLSNGKEAVRVNADVTNWYYRGTDTTKITASWGEGNDTYVLHDNAEETVTWNFKAGEEFKLTDSKTSWDNSYAATISGSASVLFSGGGSSNIKFNGTTDYDFFVTLSGGNIYFDYAGDFYYAGSDKDKQGSAWTSWTEKPITVNGDAVTFDLSLKEEFKLRPACDKTTWDGAIGSGALSSSYYNIFTGDGNIFVNYTSSYEISVKIVNHEAKIYIEAHNPTTATVYVLDLNGDLLSSNPRAHYFSYDSENDHTIGTNWPGVEMSLVTSTNNIYSCEYWTAFDTVIFNNGTTQNYDQSLSDHAGKCLILTWNYNETYAKWTSETWLSLDAARFIDSYMKFNDANGHENAGDGTGLCKSSGWYSAAKAAYNLLDGSVKKEISGYALVANRLTDWAKANGEAFTIVSEVGSFSTVNNMYKITDLADNSAFVVIIITCVALVSLGGMLVLRKREHN